MKVNVGCGSTPTEGWVNFDNSLTVRAARWPVLLRVLRLAGSLDGESWGLVKAATTKDIRFADATVRIPCADRSVEVLYSSHMIEHLDCAGARAFLKEARRVLRPGGILRLAAPDLGMLANAYSVTGDADEFVANMFICQPRPVGVLSRTKAALIGPRHHLWMYDGPSLSRLVAEAGFTDVSVMPPGKTNIAEPGALDLEERADESVYVEAIVPGAVAATGGSGRSDRLFPA